MHLLPYCTTWYLPVLETSTRLNPTERTDR